MKTQNQIKSFHLKKLNSLIVFTYTVFFTKAIFNLFLVLVLVWQSSTGQNVNTTKSTLNLMFLDAYKGYAVVAELVEIKQREHEKLSYSINKNQIANNGFFSMPVANGVHDITVHAVGYKPMTTYFNLNNEPVTLRFHLVPINPPQEISYKYIKTLHRPNAMIMVGFVVDDTTGKPLDKVAVHSADKVAKTFTNSEGFFQLILPLAENETEIENKGVIFFVKNNYSTEVRQNFDMFPNGDTILKIRMKKGVGLNRENIIEGRVADRSIHKKN